MLDRDIKPHINITEKFIKHKNILETALKKKHQHTKAPIPIPTKLTNQNKLIAIVSKDPLKRKTSFDSMTRANSLLKEPFPREKTDCIRLTKGGFSMISKPRLKIQCSPFSLSNSLKKNISNSLGNLKEEKIVISPKVLSRKVPLPKALLLEAHSPKILSREALSPKTLSVEVHSPKTLSLETRSPKTLSHKVHLSKTLSHEAHSPQTLSHEAHSPKTLSHEARSPKTLSHEAHSPKTLSHKVHLSKTLSHEAHSPKTLSHEAHSPKTLSHEARSPKALSPKPLSPKVAIPPIEKSSKWRNTNFFPESNKEKNSPKYLGKSPSKNFISTEMIKPVLEKKTSLSLPLRRKNIVEEKSHQLEENKKNDEKPENDLKKNQQYMVSKKRYFSSEMKSPQHKTEQQTFDDKLIYYLQKKEFKKANACLELGANVNVVDIGGGNTHFSQYFT